MPNSKRQKVLSFLLVVLLYLVPNLVQDIHRVFGQHENFVEHNSKYGNQIHLHHEKCLICVFEFNVVDQDLIPVFASIQQNVSLLLTSGKENQLQNKAFHYYNLRAPPQA
jgi:hypothetical protein